MGNVPDRQEVPAAFRAYYQSRTIAEKRYLCHAPFNNMYFNSLGDVANCWLTFDNPERYTEDRSIMDIWKGPKFTALREHIRQFDLESRCKKCQYYIRNGNYVNALSKAYDNEYPITDYPSMMEFELTNTCNLECTMCTGLLSSAIRANREKLPALKSPYGQKFVDELREFIPHLHEARFNGGEPFLIKIYYQIWEDIANLNPACKIVVATNGTTLNKRVKEVLSRGNFHINISIDSLIPDRYAAIRVNGNLEQVLENFAWFRDYCKSDSRNICVMINPMRSNWEEMPEFVRFCNEQDVHLWFNTIMYPEDLSIWKLPHDELENIYRTLSAAAITPPAHTRREVSEHNLSTYKNLVENQIKTWMEDARDRREELQNTWAMPEQQEVDHKSLFISRMEDFVGSRLPKDRDRLSNVGLRLAELEEQLHKPEYVQKLYTVLYNTPIEIAVQHLAESSTEELLNKFRSFLSN